MSTTIRSFGEVMSYRADCYPLVANARAAGGGKAVSKYIDVDVFIKSFREALPGLKAQVDPDLTPKAYAYLRGGEAIIEDLTEFPAADVAPVRRGRWIEEDGIQICSECGEEHEWEDYRAPYCDTCGAKMDKEGV